MGLRALQQLLPHRLPFVRLGGQEDEARIRAGVLEIGGQLVTLALQRVRPSHDHRPARREQRPRARGLQHAAPGRLVPAQDTDGILAVGPDPAREEVFEHLLGEVGVRADDHMDAGGARGRSLGGRR
jgi:hypothetical protein